VTDSADPSTGTLLPRFGQTILISGGGTCRGCSPRGASNYHL